MTKLFDDLQPGDCFLNNSPYYGCSHHGDYAYMAPVFYKNEHIFTALTVAHQADIGNSQPTTFMPFAKDVYEEGAIDFPCVRIQRNYKDIKDIIRMCKIRIRNPEVWYGDYLAGVGAVRIGEKRVIDLCDKYGVDTIKSFIADWQEYSKKRMVDEIKKFPKASWTDEIMHDPIHGVAPDGIRIRANISIDPDEGKVNVDLTENVDSLEAGFNMSEATTRSAVLTGILNNFSSDLPRNDAVFNRINIVARENCVVGGVKPPVCASLATVGISGRLINLIQSMFAKIGPKKGLAEGSCSFGPSVSSLYGKDFRYGGRPYVNAIIYAYGGGPALFGHDGWLTYLGPQGGGTLEFDSAEIIELKMPIILGCCEIECDSGGAGQWDGAPGIRCLMRPRKDTGLWSYFLDSKVFPSKGIHGGQSGGQAAAWKVGESGEIISIPNISAEIIKSSEWIGSIWPGGGGFGSPLDRDPEKVRIRVRDGWVSLEKAKGVYGVVIDTAQKEYVVDYKATKELRAWIKSQEEGVK
jgi:N-methylhydantoinase B